MSLSQSNLVVARICLWPCMEVDNSIFSHILSNLWMKKVEGALHSSVLPFLSWLTSIGFETRVWTHWTSSSRMSFVTFWPWQLMVETCSSIFCMSVYKHLSEMWSTGVFFVCFNIPNTNDVTHIFKPSSYTTLSFVWQRSLPSQPSTINKRHWKV